MTDIFHTAAVPTAEAETFRERMRALRVRFVERSRQDGAAIAALRARLEVGEGLEGDLARQLQRTVHGLSGAAGVFGFDSISDAAHRAELCLRRLDGVAEDPRPHLDLLTVELARLWSQEEAARIGPRGSESDHR